MSTVIWGCLIILAVGCDSPSMPSRAEVEQRVAEQAVHGEDNTAKATCAEASERTYSCTVAVKVTGDVQDEKVSVSIDPYHVTALVSKDGKRIVVNEP